MRITYFFAVQHGLALGQAFGGHPHTAVFQREELGVGEVNESQHVMAKTAVYFGDMRVQSTVEIGVKINALQQYIRGQVLVVAGNFAEQADRQDDLMGYIQPHHGEFPAGGKDNVCGMWVVPDVGLSHRRNVATFGNRAAHDDHFFDELGQGGLQFQGQRQVAQRANRHQGQFAGPGAGHIHNELRAGARIQRVGGHLAAGQIAQTICAMDMGGWVFTLF